MKKTILMLVCLVLGMDVKAQNQIVDLDDIALLGTWDVHTSNGEFMHEMKVPTNYTFTDGSYTVIGFLDNSQWFFKGYWLSTAPNGRCFLHLIPWNSGESTVNFRIQMFDNGQMILRTYDGKDEMLLYRRDNSGVRSVSVDSATNGKAYLLNGSVAPENSKGIVIQDHKKVIR